MRENSPPLPKRELGYNIPKMVYADNTLKVTCVEPRSGASRKPVTSGCFSRIDRTISRCTPMPRP